MKEKITVISIWDQISSDKEWVEQVKKLMFSKNDSVSLKTCQWIGEGKGFISIEDGIDDVDMGLEDKE